MKAAGLTLALCEVVLAAAAAAAAAGGGDCSVCTMEVAPVCGQNKLVFINECVARCQGIPLAANAGVCGTVAGKWCACLFFHRHDREFGRLSCAAAAAGVSWQALPAKGVGQLPIPATPDCTCSGSHRSGSRSARHAHNHRFLSSAR